ncbi:MAG TPA: L-aspartate oxidase [Bryobacteraceae bacterium]|nr:L-aspartate oxidase [Bryobacteraceae bacterium]
MHPDFLVIGAGVAGLRAAIELAEAGQVLVIAKEGLRESSSEYAQGGIAVALSDDDEVSLHERDTLNAGDGLCDPAAVRALVEEGPGAIQQLMEWGAEFDRQGSKLAFTREGAHSRNRVLHAQGDSTGREIARTLYFKAASLPNVEFRSYAMCTGLLRGDGVTGAELYDAAAGGVVRIQARAVLLATGGLGNVFFNTTNPDVATGDGVALAWRAGAEIADMEFVQFHPTALHAPGAPRFLLSEALRGEGGRLVNARGERFMEGVHPLRELAPRDVVARAIVAEMRREGSEHVFLDLTHRDAGFLRARFPRITETCLRYGIDLARDKAPVAPAAHYAMGGVSTDLDGRTSVARLFAAGEAACAGVHGANRLASNSLLEGLVYGARAGRAMRQTGAAAPAEATPPEAAWPGGLERQEIQRIAWERCGIVRDAEGLRGACELLEAVGAAAPGRLTPERAEARNMQQVALLIARSALARQESRGAHFRTDFPEKSVSPAQHSVAVGDRPIGFRPNPQAAPEPCVRL